MKEFARTLIGAGGRKFFAVMYAITLTAGLVYFKLVGEENYTTIVISLVVGFIGGNVWQKVGTKDGKNEPV